MTESAIPTVTVQQRTRDAITARLVDRHGLTEQQAMTAIANSNAGILDEYSGVVGQAVVGLIVEQWAQVWQAVQPAFQALAGAFSTLTKHTGELAKLIPADYVLAPEPWEPECDVCEGLGSGCDRCGSEPEAAR